MRRLTGRLCVVEAQLTEQHAPIRHGWGVTDEFEAEPASWAAPLEPGQETHPIASHGGAISLIPNRAALLQALEAAGFRRVEPLPVPTGLNRQYVGGHRLAVAAWPYQPSVAPPHPRRWVRRRPPPCPRLALTP